MRPFLKINIILWIVLALPTISVCQQTKGYINPSVYLNVGNFQSSLTVVSSIKKNTKQSERKERNIIDFTTVIGNDLQQVIVINPGSTNVVTFFVDNMKNDESKGMMTTITTHAHRRKIILNGNGYEMERYVILAMIDTKSGIIMSMMFAKENTDIMTSYYKYPS